MSARCSRGAVRHSLFRADLLVGLATFVMVGQAVGFLFVGCDSNAGRAGQGTAAAATTADTDPLASLASPTASPRYGREYWIAVSGSGVASDTAVWRRALEACGTGAAVTERPNCNTVRYVATVRGWGRGADLVDSARRGATSFRVAP